MFLFVPVYLVVHCGSTVKIQHFVSHVEIFFVKADFHLPISGTHSTFLCLIVDLGMYTNSKEHMSVIT